MKFNLDIPNSAGLKSPSKAVLGGVRIGSSIILPYSRNWKVWSLEETIVLESPMYKKPWLFQEGYDISPRNKCSSNVWSCSEDLERSAACLEWRHVTYMPWAFIQICSTFDGVFPQPAIQGNKPLEQRRTELIEIPQPCQYAITQKGHLETDLYTSKM